MKSCPIMLVDQVFRSRFVFRLFSATEAHLSPLLLRSLPSMSGMKLSPALVRKLGQIGQSMHKKDNNSLVTECITYLKNNREQISSIHYILHQGLVPMTMSSQGLETLPPCCTRLRVVSLDLKEKVILKHSQLDRSALKTIHSHNDQNISNMFFFLLDKHAETPIEHHFEDEFMGWVDARAQEAGNRLRKFEAISKGEPAWNTCGLMYLAVEITKGHFSEPNTLPDENEYFTHVVHRFAEGVAIDLPKDRVTSTWNFQHSTFIDKIHFADGEGFVLDITTRLKAKNPEAFEKWCA